MKIIPASVEILDAIDGDAILKKIELCGRVCYKSEERITPDSARKFVKNIIKSGHESVLEHVSFSVRFICDRGVSHEIVRHRIASYSQESTRYCNYAKDGFGNEITVIEPCLFTNDSPEYSYWRTSCLVSEDSYFRLLEEGRPPQEARSVLPNSLKTELIMTANLREWRHFFKLRTAAQAHPQMREVACMLLEKVRELVPVVFDDIESIYSASMNHYLRRYHEFMEELIMPLKNEPELELTDDMNERIDVIDNAVYDCICALAEEQIEWSMKDIGEVTEVIKIVLRKHDINVRHPRVVTELDGSQHYED